MNLRELKDLFRLVEKTDFTEVEIVHGDLRVRIERGKPTMVLSPATPPQGQSITHSSGVDSNPAPSAPAQNHATSVSSVLGEDIKNDKEAFVTSPFVGTFYITPSPDADPYVRLNQRIVKGQILCIVEAMKLMNEIESDIEGKIVEIYPENGQPVEFGEKLFRIELMS